MHFSIVRIYSSCHSRVLVTFSRPEAEGASAFCIVCFLFPHWDPSSFQGLQAQTHLQRLFRCSARPAWVSEEPWFL